MTTDVGDVPTAIVTSDFDLDGRPDVAVANDNSNTLTVLYGDGTGNFPASDTLLLVPGDTSPVSVAAGDFDGDGDDDLATVAFGADMLSVFENKRRPDVPRSTDAGSTPPTSRSTWAPETSTGTESRTWPSPRKG